MSNVDFDNPYFCVKCGRRWGDHLTEIELSKNPQACRFVPKPGNVDYGKIDRGV